MKRVTAKAPVNIALIKYWGKQDIEKVIPFNSSLSLTLDNLYTLTTIEQSDSFAFYLNGVKQNKYEENKVKTFLKHFGSFDQISNVTVTSINHVPTAAGLASSASAYAALSKAANSFFKTNFDLDTLIAISRTGSGSSCRSFHGGFVAWEIGGNVYPVNSLCKDFMMISVIVSNEQKTISSRVAMEHTVETSELYPYWVSEANKDFIEIKKALLIGDIKTIGELTEKSARLMHAVMLAANTPILYCLTESIQIWEIVANLRKNNIYAYATMDAGPNVKILTTVKDYQTVLEKIHEAGFKDHYISNIGEGAIIIDENY